jgi:hypothetical protein
MNWIERGRIVVVYNWRYRPDFCLGFLKRITKISVRNLRLHPKFELGKYRIKVRTFTACASWFGDVSSVYLLHCIEM